MMNMPNVPWSSQACTLITFCEYGSHALQKPVPPTPLADMLAPVECHLQYVKEPAPGRPCSQVSWVVRVPSVQAGIIPWHHWLESELSLSQFRMRSTIVTSPRRCAHRGQVL